MSGGRHRSSNRPSPAVDESYKIAISRQIDIFRANDEDDLVFPPDLDNLERGYVSGPCLHRGDHVCMHVARGFKGGGMVNLESEWMLTFQGEGENVLVGRTSMARAVVMLEWFRGR